MSDNSFDRLMCSANDKLLSEGKLFTNGVVVAGISIVTFEGSMSQML